MYVHPAVRTADLQILLSMLPEQAEPLRAETLAEIAARLAAGAPQWAATGVQTGRRGLRLLVSHQIEARLVAWETGRTTPAHDHGGAPAAWAVADGELVEDQFDAPVWLSGPRRRRVAAPAAATLPPGQVHVLANPGPRRALSVHVVAPPRRARLRPARAAAMLAEAVPWHALAATAVSAP